MDLISGLSSALGVDPAAAQAIAGTVLGGVKTAVAEDRPEAAAAIDQAVPELPEWEAKADTVEQQPASGLGGMLGGAGGGLLGAAAGALGGTQAKELAAVVGILGKVGVDASKAQLVAPMVLKFLESRLDKGTLSMVLSAAPMLAGAADKGEGGGIAGALGGLFS